MSIRVRKRLVFITAHTSRVDYKPRVQFGNAIAIGLLLGLATNSQTVF